MATLDDLRTKLRLQLDDSDAAAQIWSDAQLEEHINKAISAYDAYVPTIHHQDTRGTGARSYLLTEDDQLYPLKVEYPIDQNPPSFLPFVTSDGVGGPINVLGDVIPTLASAEDPTNIRLFYRAMPALQDFPEHHEQSLLTGAWGYALRARARKLTELFNPQPGSADRLFTASQTALAEFGSFLVLAREERTHYDTINYDILVDPDTINRYRAHTLEMLAEATKDTIEQGSMSAADARTLINRYTGLAGNPPTTTEAIGAQTPEENARTLKFIAEATKALISQQAIDTGDARMLVNLFSELTGAAPDPAVIAISAETSAGLALALQRLGNGLEDLIRQGVISRQQARQLLNMFASTTGDVPPEDPSAAAGSTLSWEG